MKKPASPGAPPSVARRTSLRVQDIAPARLAALHQGQVQTTLLAECLAMDFATLLRQALPEAGEDIALVLEAEAATGISRRMARVAGLLLARLGPQALPRLRVHASDTVRGWACFMVGALPNMPLPERLALIRPLADDLHFGVREWAWLAVRPHLAAELTDAIALLAGWTADPSERVRRFASEAIRPRGVWCAHLAPLKQCPALALPVLEALRSDPSPSVQDSVGNWLNDAAKSQPAWVRALCLRWQQESPTPATARVVRRACRSIDPLP